MRDGDGQKLSTNGTWLFVDELFEEVDQLIDVFIELRDQIFDLEDRQDDFEEILFEIEDTTVERVLDEIEDQGFLDVSSKWRIG